MDFGEKKLSKTRMFINCFYIFVRTILNFKLLIMKKITLLTLALIASVCMNAQIQLTHSLDLATVNAGVACGVAGGATAQNNWWRSYVPDDFGVTGDFQVNNFEFGVGQVDFDDADLSLTLYSTDAAFPTGTLTVIGSAIYTATAADVGTIITLPLDTPAVVSNTDEVVVELIGLDNDVVAFRIGMNEGGETADSYLSAGDCSITDPTPISVIGFPDNIILNLEGDNALSVGDAIEDIVSVFPNPATTVLNVNVPSNIEVNSANLYDVLGKDTGVQLVDGQMNTSNLARGVYILNVNTEAGTLTQKIVKQ